MEHANPHEGVRLITSIYRMAIDGDRRTLKAQMQAMAESGFADPEGYFLLAPFVAQAGAPGEALGALQHAVTGGYFCPESLRNDPYWEGLRGTDEFAKLLARSDAGTARGRLAFDRAGGASILSPTS
jgi:hypothetical protein